MAKYSEVLDEHRRRLARVAERRGVERVKRLYDSAQSEVISKVAKTAGKGTYTAATNRGVLVQLRQGQAQIAQAMAGELGDISQEAQVESLRGLSGTVRKLENEYVGAAPPLPIDEASVFAGVVDGRAASLMQMHESSMMSYGATVVGKMEEALGVSVLQEESTIDAIDRVQRLAENEFWQAERIVRTEVAYAQNATLADGVAEVLEVLPDLLLRWTEYVDDATWQPRDSRVGVDSIAMHGQVVEPGKFFVMPDETPDGEEVPDSLAGMGWQFPPDRPNDRATVLPWRKEWGVPAWRWDGDKRLWL